MGDASTPGSGCSSAQTEPRRALGAPKRGPVAERGGREGKVGRGERRASGGQRHPFIPPSEGAPAHTYTPSPIHNDESEATRRGDLPPSAPAATCRSRRAGVPATPLGRGLGLGGRAKPFGAPRALSARPAAPLRTNRERAPK